MANDPSVGGEGIIEKPPIPMATPLAEPIASPPPPPAPRSSGGRLALILTVVAVLGLCVCAVPVGVLVVPYFWVLHQENLQGRAEIAAEAELRQKLKGRDRRGTTIGSRHSRKSANSTAR
jgi:hypothetical protein